VYSVRIGPCNRKLLCRNKFRIPCNLPNWPSPATTSRCRDPKTQSDAIDGFSQPIPKEHRMRLAGDRLKNFDDSISVIALSLGWHIE
jgi:hypothetical protein